MQSNPNVSGNDDDRGVSNLNGKPDNFNMFKEYECRECWDKGCSICTIIDPESGEFIPVKQFEDEVYESEIYDMDELCTECHDPDCIPLTGGCND